MRRRLSIRSSLISNTGVLVHIVETRSRRQRERERDSLTRTTHPSGYISSRGSRRGRIKKKKKKKKGRVEYSEPIAWKSFAEYSSCETGDNYLISAVANNETTTTTTAKSFCPRSDAIFSAVSSSPSLFLSLCLSSWGRKREEEEREKKKLSRCSDQLTLMSDIFGRLAKLAREPFSYGGMPPRHQKQYTP